MERPKSYERHRRAVLAMAVISLSTAMFALNSSPLGSDTVPVPAPPSAPHKQTQEILGEKQELYPIHASITATVFWAGEAADSSNGFIHNSSSAWVEDWVGSYGGIDDPTNRCGFNPCAFTPRENPFYFALPYNDLTEEGVRKDSAKNIPWYADTISSNPRSIVKNRWIKLTHNDKIAYAQWEDIGPFYYDDFDYVFGDSAPTSPRAGIDLSPATASALNLEGRGVISWQFVEDADVPTGPWRTVITHNN